MTTQADIKLVIDQVITALRNADAVIPTSTVNTLETLGNQIAAQSAVIVVLRMAMHDVDSVLFGDKIGFDHELT